MAPMISSSKNKKEQMKKINDFKKEKNKLLQFRKYIEKNFEYVGSDFSRKVREFHYDNKNKKYCYCLPLGLDLPPFPQGDPIAIPLARGPR